MNFADIILSAKDKECTAYPFWAIVSPLKNGRYQLLDGVWFNREDAEAFRQANAHNYPKDATVFCFSGNRSAHLRELYELANAEVAR